MEGRAAREYYIEKERERMQVDTVLRRSVELVHDKPE